MSSLQKFHRRTNGGVPVVVSPFTAIGSGNNTAGFWLGTAGNGSSKLIAAPKSTEIYTGASSLWGAYGVTCSTFNTTDGYPNTITMVSKNCASAVYCRSLTTGGYNTWYLPATGELQTMYANKNATPFSSSNAFMASTYWSSVETSGNNNAAQKFDMVTGVTGSSGKQNNQSIRAVRTTTV